MNLTRSNAGTIGLWALVPLSSIYGRLRLLATKARVDSIQSRSFEVALVRSDGEFCRLEAASGAPFPFRRH